MHIPKFGGADDEKTTTDSASFRSDIHDNTKFKLLYLRSCLSAKALNKIQSLEISDANYAVAWDILETNYFDFMTLLNRRVKCFNAWLLKEGAKSEVVYNNQFYKHNCPTRYVGSERANDPSAENGQHDQPRNG